MDRQQNCTVYRCVTLLLLLYVSVLKLGGNTVKKVMTSYAIWLLSV